MNSSFKNVSDLAMMSLAKVLNTFHAAVGLGKAAFWSSSSYLPLCWSSSQCP